MKTIYSTIILCVIAFSAMAQFAPPAGQAGSTALHKDSSIFVAWASHCTLQRGYRDISNPSLGLVTYGDSTEALGAPNATGVISLGDGGSATVSFRTPIVNGPGWDFAVFENAFVDTFLELSFVEVSSDGINFHRFPATSNTQDSIQVGSFGGLDATKINNLAGKYIVNYGTPFDLEELKNVVGLDVNHVTHVRIIDVVGCIQDTFARYDKNNHRINDPWRTDFLTGGFDLDAIGVINTWPTAVTTAAKKNFQFKLFPNPSSNGVMNISFVVKNNSEVLIELYDWQGRKIYQKTAQSIIGANNIHLNISTIPKGNYLLRLSSDKVQLSEKLILH